MAEGLRVLRDVGQPSLAMTDGTAARTATTRNRLQTVMRGVPLIGDLLIEMGLVTRAAFEAALTSYRPDRDGRIGDYMVARHVISRDALRLAMAATAAHPARTGGAPMNHMIMRRRSQPTSSCLGPRWRAWAAAWALSALSAIPAQPVHADENLPLPLAGAAYRVAQSAYAAYGAHRYADSASLAREAIRQRPDVVELRLLLANSLAAGGQREAASRELSAAIAMLGRAPR